jgi:uncharacterized protein YciI
MLIVQVTFKDREALAANRDAHAAWLREGADAGLIIAAGTIAPQEAGVPPAGGMILVAGADRAALAARLEQAPLITSGAASAEIIELRLSFTDERAAFLGTETTASRNSKAASEL